MSSADINSHSPAREAKDPLQYAVESRDVDVLTMVREALAEGRAQLAFQPVYTAGADRQIAFHEGLIRVQDKTGRIIPARQFMGAIEKTDLGREIDCASLRLGLQTLRDNPYSRVSINTSARSIADGRWRRIMDQVLAQDPALAERLILEIGEDQAMLLPEVVVRFMEDMHPMGLGFALDDFGGGMTAFRHLKDFVFDLVKLDSCFVRGIERDADNQVMAEALIMVAQQFEMFVVASGVETAGEAGFLETIGVDCLQGYHFGVPRFALS